MPQTQAADVLVVGARCAGAATAMLLARAGHDVVVVDRAHLPSDTVSTHALARGAMVQLTRWGILDTVVASGAPPVRTVDFYQHDGETTLASRHRVKHRAGVDHLLAPRRRELDRVLVEAAAAAGARVRDRTSADRVIVDGAGRATGILAHTPEGRQEVRARFVIGADGLHSRVARQVGARTVRTDAPGGVCLYAYVGDVPWHGFELHVARRRFAGVFPTHGNQAAVFLMLPTGEADALLGAGADRSRVWLDHLRQASPDLADRVAAGSLVGAVRGTVSLPQHVRRAAGPGWALVGDAGYHRDPVTAHGITDAFRDAELLAGAVDALLGDPNRELEALAEFERERDRALAETYEITRELAAFPDMDRFLQLQKQLARALDQEAATLAALPPPPFRPADDSAWSPSRHLEMNR